MIGRTLPALAVRGLAHRYGTFEALHDVSFEVAPGAFFGLLGPNGSGKSTLFKIVATLLRPSAGTVTVHGLDVVSQAAAVRTHLGVIFQHPALDRDLSVLENMRFHGALLGLSGRPLAARIDALLDLFQLADRARSRVKTLSGGQVRRVDLARGLLHQPRLLLLDEPTTGLDLVARRDLWDALAHLRATEGTTLVVATHLMDEADRCDDLVILNNGHLVAHGAPRTLTDALGVETLWIESDDPAALASRLTDDLGLVVRTVGTFVLVEHPDPASVLGPIYARFHDAIRSATLRRPTLEDVFLSHTGRSLESVV